MNYTNPGIQFKEQIAQAVRNFGIKSSQFERLMGGNPNIDSKKLPKSTVSDTTNFSQFSNNKVLPINKSQTNNFTNFELKTLTYFQKFEMSLTGIQSILTQTLNESINNVERVNNELGHLRNVSILRADSIDFIGRLQEKSLSAIVEIVKSGVTNEQTVMGTMKLFAGEYFNIFFDNFLAKFQRNFNFLAVTTAKRLDDFGVKYNMATGMIRTYTLTAAQIIAKHPHASPAVLTSVFLSNIYETLRFLALDIKATSNNLSINDLSDQLQKALSFTLKDVVVSQLKKFFFTSIFGKILSPVVFIGNALTSAIKSISKFIKDDDRKNKIVNKYSIKKTPDVITADAASKLPGILEEQRVILANIYEILQNSFFLQNSLLTSLTGTTYTFKETQSVAKKARTYVPELGEFLNDAELIDYNKKKKTAVKKDVDKSLKWTIRGLFESENSRTRRADELIKKIDGINKKSDTNALTDLLDLRNNAVGKTNALANNSSLSGGSTSPVAGTTVFEDIVDYLELIANQTLPINDIYKKANRININLSDKLNTTNTHLFNIHKILFDAKLAITSMASIIGTKLTELYTFYTARPASVRSLYDMESHIVRKEFKPLFKELTDKTFDLYDWLLSQKILVPQSTTTSIGPIPRQMGGPVSSDRTYVVGERGPELFIPNHDGSIVPNSALFTSPEILINIIAEGINKSKVGRVAKEQLHVNTAERLAELRARRESQRRIIPIGPSPNQNLPSDNNVEDDTKKPGFFKKLFSGISKAFIIGGLLLAAPKLIPMIGKGIGFLVTKLFENEALGEMISRISSGEYSEFINPTLKAITLGLGAIFVLPSVIKGLGFALGMGIAALVKHGFKFLFLKLPKLIFWDLPKFLGKDIAKTAGHVKNAISFLFRDAARTFTDVKAIGKWLARAGRAGFTDIKEIGYFFKELYKRSFVSIFSKISSLIPSGIKSIFSKSGEFIGKFIPKLLGRFVTGAFGFLFDGVLSFFKARKEGKGLGASLLDGLKGALTSSSMAGNVIKYGLAGLAFGGIGVIPGMLIGAAIQLISDNWGSIVDFGKGIKDWISNSWNTATGYLTSSISNVITFIFTNLSTSWNWIKKKFEPITNTFKAIKKLFSKKDDIPKIEVEKVSGIGKWIEDFIFRPIFAIETFLKDAKAKINAIPDRISELVGNFGNWIADLFDRIMTSVKNTIAEIPGLKLLLDDDFRRQHEIDKLNNLKTELDQLKAEREKLQAEAAELRTTAGKSPFGFWNKTEDHKAADDAESRLNKMNDEIDDRLKSIESSEKKINDLPKRQFGGPVRINTVYNVGEKGPELFIDKMGNISLIGTSGPELFSSGNAGDIFPIIADKNALRVSLHNARLVPSETTVSFPSLPKITPLVTDSSSIIKAEELSGFNKLLFDISTLLRTGLDIYSKLIFEASKLIEITAKTHQQLVDYTSNNILPFIFDKYNSAVRYTSDKIIPASVSGYDRSVRYTSETAIPTIQNSRNSAIDYTSNSIIPAMASGYESSKDFAIESIKKLNTKQTENELIRRLKNNEIPVILYKLDENCYYLQFDDKTTYIVTRDKMPFALNIVKSLYDNNVLLFEDRRAKQKVSPDDIKKHKEQLEQEEKNKSKEASDKEDPLKDLKASFDPSVISSMLDATKTGLQTTAHTIGDLSKTAGTVVDPFLYKDKHPTVDPLPTSSVAPFGGVRDIGGEVIPSKSYLIARPELFISNSGDSALLIGQNGPELFTPTTSGYIFPQSINNTDANRRQLELSQDANMWLEKMYNSKSPSFPKVTGMPSAFDTSSQIQYPTVDTKSSDSIDYKELKTRQLQLTDSELESKLKNGNFPINLNKINSDKYFIRFTDRSAYVVSRNQFPKSFPLVVKLYTDNEFVFKQNDEVSEVTSDDIKKTQAKQDAIGGKALTESLPESVRDAFSGFSELVDAFKESDFFETGVTGLKKAMQGIAHSFGDGSFMTDQVDRVLYSKLYDTPLTPIIPMYGGQSISSVAPLHGSKPKLPESAAYASTSETSILPSIPNVAIPDVSATISSIGAGTALGDFVAQGMAIAETDAYKFTKFQKSEIVVLNQIRNLLYYILSGTKLGGAAGGVLPGSVGSFPGLPSIFDAVPGIPGVGGMPGFPGMPNIGVGSKSSGSIITSSGTKALLDQIALGEGTTDEKAQKHGYASAYDVPLGYGKYGGKAGTTKPVSQMTIGEVKALQKEILKGSGKLNSSAIGKYQIVGTTLRGLQEEMGLSDDQLFDAELQDKLATQLLKRRGYDKFLSGEISAEDLQKELYKEWASIAHPETKRAKQHTGTSHEQIQAALKAAKDNTTIAGQVNPTGQQITGISEPITPGTLSELQSRTGGKHIDVDNLDASYAGSLGSFMKEAEEVFGKKLTIQSGYRPPTKAERDLLGSNATTQQEIIDSQGKSGRVASTYGSKHGTGQASDLRFEGMSSIEDMNKMSKSDREKWLALAQKHNLDLPLRDKGKDTEWWHVEPVGLERGGSKLRGQEYVEDIKRRSLKTVESQQQIADPNKSIATEPVIDFDAISKDLKSGKGTASSGIGLVYDSPNLSDPNQMIDGFKQPTISPERKELSDLIKKTMAQPDSEDKVRQLEELVKIKQTLDAADAAKLTSSKPQVDETKPEKSLAEREAILKREAEYEAKAKAAESIATSKPISSDSTTKVSSGLPPRTIGSGSWGPNYIPKFPSIFDTPKIPDISDIDEIPDIPKLPSIFGPIDIPNGGIMDEFPKTPNFNPYSVLGTASGSIDKVLSSIFGTDGIGGLLSGVLKDGKSGLLSQILSQNPALTKGMDLVSSILGGSGISGIFSSLFGKLGLGGLLGDISSKMGGGIFGGMGSRLLSGILNPIMSSISGLMSSIMGGLSGMIGGALNPIIGGITKGLGGIFSGGLGGILGGAGSFLGGGFDILKSAGSGILKAIGGSGIGKFLGGGFDILGQAGKGILGDAGSFLGGGFDILGEAGKGIMSDIGGLFPGRASGGPVNSQSPYIVGEKGPELFVPNASGNIVPSIKLNPPQTQFDVKSTTNALIRENNESKLQSLSQNETSSQLSTHQKSIPVDMNIDKVLRHHAPSSVDGSSNNLTTDINPTPVDPLGDNIAERLFSLLGPTLLYNLKSQAIETVQNNYIENTSFS